MNGTRKYKLFGLDSNLFIYHFEDHPVFVKYTDILFENLSKGTCKAVTSIISIVETLSYPLPKSTLQTIEEKFKTIPNFRIFDVNEKIALEAARLRREYKLKLGDSVQLATCLHTRAKAFITNDEKLKGFKEIDIVLLNDIN